MKYLIAPVVATCLIASMSRAAEPATPAPAPAPATPAPVADDGDVPGLIKQLGHEDPKVREAASGKLRRLGQVAIPALADAQKSDDPEVASRAQAVARQIEEDRNPAPAVEGRGFDPRTRMLLDLGRNRMRLGNANAFGGAGVGGPVNVGRPVREVNTVDGGKRIKIRQDVQGITVVTAERTPDGAEVTKTTKAKDAAALKREFPEVYPLYEKHAAALRTNVLDLQIDPLGPDGQVEVERAVREARRMIEEHRPMIDEQRRIADEQLREARRQLDEQVRQLREEKK